MAASTAKWRSSLWDLSHKLFTLYKVYCQLLYIHIYSILSSSITTTLALLCWLECLLHSSCLMFWLKISQKVSMICSLPETRNNCFSPLTKKKNTYVFSISDCELLTLDLYYALQKQFFFSVSRTFFFCAMNLSVQFVCIHQELIEAVAPDLDCWASSLNILTWWAIEFPLEE